MSQPYVGEIIMFGGNFAPQGWAFCNGQLLSIADNDVLFALIGTTYGGDGQNTFGVPDLRGRVPVHQGTGPGLSTKVIGEKSGTETVTITTQQMPAHNHIAVCSTNDGSTTNPAGNVWAAQPALLQYAPAAGANTNLNVAAISNAGGNQPHDNQIPYTVVNYVISLFGVFPSPN